WGRTASAGTGGRGGAATSAPGDRRCRTQRTRTLQQRPASALGRERGSAPGGACCTRETRVCGEVKRFLTSAPPAAPHCPSVKRLAPLSARFFPEAWQVPHVPAQQENKLWPCK